MYMSKMYVYASMQWVIFVNIGLANAVSLAWHDIVARMIAIMFFQ